MVDGVSKYLEITALWIGQHGTPQKIFTDQGSQMDGIDIRDMCSEFGIDKEHSSPHHSEGDGLCERTIGLVKQLFTSMLPEKHLSTKDWTTIIPGVMIA